ncbi:histamine H2 receptor-like [Dendronephthya gigantea]|uniref:histamine H2 receptor-like n=1 Tax=Dendronephthya gigantea TaxID=151771 RepID=UPI00106C1F8E|nr:histamine H2 receptor-like [Dendronephthya gigantea]
MSMKMNKSNIVVCQHISIFHEYTGNHSSTDMISDIITCIVNAVLAILTTIGNSCIIFAYHDNRTLQTKSNLLIVALAFTDLLVGILVQPLFVWVKIKQMMGNIDCLLEIISDLSTKFSFGISLLTLGLIVSTERYFAVFYPLKHHTWLTKKKLFYSILVVWVTAAIAVLSILLGIPRVVYQPFGLTLIVLSLATSLFLYIKIARKIRTMKSRTAPSPGLSRVKRVSWTSNPSQIRAAVTMFYVLGSLFICWIPMLSGFLYVSIQGQNLVYQKFLWTWGVTCVFLNSFCNPFIYSWRNRNMSTAIRRLFVKGNHDVDGTIVNLSMVRQSYSMT